MIPTSRRLEFSRSCTWTFSSEQVARFEAVLADWQVAADAEFHARGFTHQSDYVHATVGAKYARFDIGGSGAFMVDIATGTVYGIKGYGKVDTKKVSGTIYDPGFNGAVLVRDRFRRGRFINRPDGTPRTAYWRI